TTILKAEQEAAYQSLRRGVMEDDRRHGYRGAESYVDMTAITYDQDEGIDEALQDVADAARMMDKAKGAMQLRTLQTLDGLGPTSSNTVVMALPVEVLEWFKKGR
ncbi:MAG TPA: hypothetical protein PKY99_14020, partial [Turneriella sp.]|nr:hypothetical protein [Turneriella sp.]